MDSLADSNVLLDVFSKDLRWSPWSAAALARCLVEGVVHINPVIFAEISIGFSSIDEVTTAFPAGPLKYENIPVEAAFLAGKAYVRYRKQSGTRTSLLPDFLIGAHAAVSGLRLITRDAKRYRTYFPTVTLLCPP